MNAPLVLLYNLDNRNGSRLRLICLKLHIRVRTVAPTELAEPVGALASWLPYNFFSNEVAINQSGLAEFLWDTPAGLAKCLIAGFAGVAVFGIAGLWRASKREL